METHTGRWIALAGVWLVYCAFGATAASLAPLLPEIRAELTIDNTTLGAILGAWPLVYIFVAIPAGGFLDWAGPRASLFLAALFIAASALMRGVADSAGSMLLAVALFGVGGPLISVGAPKIITGLFSGKSRGTAIGIYLTGPALGGVMTLTLTNDWLVPLAGTWRGVMGLHAVFAAAAGCLWLIAAGFARLHLTAANRQSFSLGALRSLLALAEVRIILLLAFGGFFLNHALNNWLAAILRAKGMEAASAGYWAAIPLLVGLAAGLIIPRQATPGRRHHILLGLCLTTMATSLIIAQGSGAWLFTALAAQGIVRGAMNAVVVLILTEIQAIPPSRMGVASGLYFTAGEIGGVLGPFSVGALFDLTGGYTAALFVLAFVAAGLALASMILRSQQADRV